jgi:hypothetical protein
MKQYVMSVYLANRWGSMVERERYLKAPSQHEAKQIADKILINWQAKDSTVYPTYDLRENVA